MPTIAKTMVRIGNYIYREEVTGDWLVIAKVVQGIDGEYYQWYA